MRDNGKTRKILLKELQELRDRCNDLETSQAHIDLMKEALLRSEERLRDLVALLPGVMFETDIDCNLVATDSEAFSKCGYFGDEPGSGVHTYQLVAQEDRDGIRTALADKLSGRTAGACDGDYTILTKNGDKIPATVFSTPVIREGATIGLRGIALNISARKNRNGKFMALEAPLRAIMDNFPLDLWVVGPDGCYCMQSSISRKLWGDFVGKRPEESMQPKQMRDRWREYNQRALAGEIVKGEFTYQVKGEQRSFYSFVAPIVEDGSILGIIGVNIDITENKHLEQKYLQAQKMEAMGQLASGIAHDFNNVLTAIIGYQYLLQPQLQENRKARYYAEQVTALAEKATNLTQTLLAFGRKRTDNPKIVNLNDLIRNMSGLLKRLIGEDIELKTVLETAPLPIMAVAVQIEHIVMNLATNARDAMPGGGSLLVKTERIEIDGDFIRAHGFGKAGYYAVVSVTDTGVGMDEKTRTRIFEPFFTTKEAGKGTGLGLATAYGLIQLHGGHIHVYSEPGEGTTFRIYLPLDVSCSTNRSHPKKDVAPPRGTETVLLAEDEESVRTLLRSILEKYGYQVIEAVDGDQALEKYLIHEAEIDALILDVIMPKRNGKEVFDIIRKGAPNVKALFISGYNEEMIEQKGIGDRCHVVSKPLSPHAFLKILRQVLGAGADSSNAPSLASCPLCPERYNEPGIS